MVKDLQDEIHVSLPMEDQEHKTQVKLNSRTESMASVVESDLSHQPSAEFLERLEKVNKQQEMPFIVDQNDENNLNKLHFAGDGASPSHID